MKTMRVNRVYHRATSETSTQVGGPRKGRGFVHADKHFSDIATTIATGLNGSARNVRDAQRLEG